MSTRATYQIKSGFSTVTFYIHHDGYFEGAALYFRNTLDFMRVAERPLLPCFLWANDTEYHYDLEQRSGVWWVYALKRQSWDTADFELEWAGPVSLFVDEFNPQEAA
jgi:hypothetical protein